MRGAAAINQPSARRIVIAMNWLGRFTMLRYESQWFDSLFRILLVRVFLRVFLKTEPNKIL
jgi:hypothetical protein